MEKKTIVARVEVLPGKEQEFISKAEPLIQETRNEEGNISYNLYQNPTNPVAFIFYEEYKPRCNRCTCCIYTFPDIRESHKRVVSFRTDHRIILNKLFSHS